MLGMWGWRQIGWEGVAVEGNGEGGVIGGRGWCGGGSEGNGK